MFSSSSCLGFSDHMHPIDANGNNEELFCILTYGRRDPHVLIIIMFKVFRPHAPYRCKW